MGYPLSSTPSGEWRLQTYFAPVRSSPWRNGGSFLEEGGPREKWPKHLLTLGASSSNSPRHSLRTACPGSTNVRLHPLQGAGHREMRDPKA
ncbi:unnamed protein product [Rangifer tarandus platyrhynchus]|uniref:Uncharacterized protein n=1 Tax=Rangifer tarandus platyrhynchus TaxID=3082113 RepID=A0ABN8ZK29_RANTA|nr:unnamed protein product [Rangifer tarandus platyrhynchus]